jgi:beta-fructofuranosidase
MKENSFTVEAAQPHIFKNIIQVDMSQSSFNKPDYNEFVMLFIASGNNNQKVDTQEAPFLLKPNEKIELRIFLGKTMLEVFVNNCQCVTQVIYPTFEDAIHVQVFTDDAPIIVEDAKAWKLFPAMQW